MLVIITCLVVFLLLTVFFGFLLFSRLNQYIIQLENKIENTTVIIENLKQSFRDVMVDASFLLDDGKMKRMPIQKEKNMIYNGIDLEEQVTTI